MDDDPEQLLSMFMSLGTTDHEELIGQFLQIVQGGSGRDTAQFFLEANNWNLQAAISSYFDQGQMVMPTVHPQAELVGELTTGEGDVLEMGQPFRKTWRLRNTGAEPWPQSTRLVCVSGNIQSEDQWVPLPGVEPGEEADVSMAMLAPSEVGQFTSTWRLRHSEGVATYFGEEIWVVIGVTEDGTLDIMEQLSATTLS